MERWPDALRWVPKLTHRDEKTDTKTVWPVMLARWIAPDNTASTLHRTWLNEPGVKAPVDPPRKAMPGPIPVGGAVRLAPPAETMGIAEGIETALAAALIYGIPVWSALGTSGLVRWQPPKEATSIMIFADKDMNYAGQHAAYNLAYRLHSEGRHVDVREPEGEAPCDFNDMLT
jgi:putative DNA primase/helicase